MATHEKKLEIWRALSRQMGCPPKDSEEYFQKTEAYYHILEELNAQDNEPPPPRSSQRELSPHRAPQREPADSDVRHLEMHMQRQRGVCYCDCHRTGGRPQEPVRRHKVTRCDTSDSDSDDSFGSRVPSRVSPRPPPQEKEKEKRGRGRPRKVVVSDSESDSNSDSEEEVKPKLKKKLEVPAPKKKPAPKKDTKKSNTKRSSR